MSIYQEYTHQPTPNNDSLDFKLKKVCFLKEENAECPTKNSYDSNHVSIPCVPSYGKVALPFEG